MEDLLNVELLKLQDELSKLGKAVSHIGRAEQLTQSVIDGSKSIQAQYVAQLAGIQQYYTDFLQKSLAATEGKLTLFADKQQQQVDGFSQALKQYVELGQRTEAIAADHLEKALQQYGEYLRNTSSFTETQIQNLVESNQQQINEVRKLIQGHRAFLEKQEELGINQLETAMLHNAELLKQNFANTETQILGITEAHKKQIDDVNHVFQTYIDLSQSTSQLIREIRSVDFPARLNSISTDVTEFKKTVDNTMASIQTIENEVARVNAIDWKSIAMIPVVIEEQRKDIQQLKIGIVLVGILALASTVAAFLF
ncbi:MAG: hypothetical protein RIS47_1094 [Bacteroidota bacterium]|jgi:hypothetical protein